MDMIGEMWRQMRGKAHPTAGRVIENWIEAVAKRPNDLFGAWDAGVGERGEVAAEESLRMLDVWYVDDAFVRGKCVDVELWLAAFDAQGALAGFQRNSMKSIYHGHPGQPTPPYTAMTCRTRGAMEATKYLGVSIGSESHQFMARVEEVREAAELGGSGCGTGSDEAVRRGWEGDVPDESRGAGGGGGRRSRVE